MVEKSSLEFIIKGDEIVHLDEIKRLDVSECITCEVKVLSVETPVIRRGFHIQEFIVGDAKGTIRLTVWENQIESMEVEKSYRVSNVTVKEFNGEKNLSTVKGTSCIEIDDIGDVYTEDEDKDDNGKCQIFIAVCYVICCSMKLWLVK